LDFFLNGETIPGNDKLNSKTYFKDPLDFFKRTTFQRKRKSSTKHNNFKEKTHFSKEMRNVIYAAF
jgi:hypothetical protein